MITFNKIHSSSFSRFGIVVIVFVLSLKLSDQSKNYHNKNNKMKSMDNMMANFDFNFNWEDEPPQHISQLDLEVKWEDEDGGDGTVAPPSKVSLYNVTMNKDYDITGPMTKLITSVANSSFHEEKERRENGNHIKKENGSMNLQSCSCDEVKAIIMTFQQQNAPSEKSAIQTTTAAPKGELIEDKNTHSKKRKNCNCKKGEKGDPGLSIVGPKGEPGHPGMLPYHLLHPESLKGERGPMGPPGPPGVCQSSCSNSNYGPRQVQRSQTSSPIPLISSTPPPPVSRHHHYRIVPGALVFRNLLSMKRMSTYVKVGSVAFVEDEEEFFGKMKGGWKRFQMGPLIP